MRKMIIVLTIMALSFLSVAPALAEGMEMCSHEPTITSLRDCVQHAYAQGHIDNVGIANSLLSKLDAAQAALARGDISAAANLLKAFINQVEAQSGKHISAEHAAHMVMHTQEVLKALT